MATFDTPTPITVTLQLFVCDVHFTASDRTDTVVTVSPRDESSAADVRAAEQIRVEYSDGRLLLKTLNQWIQWTPFSGKGGAVATIDLPTGSSLEGSLAMGHLRGEGEFGDCRLRTAMGDVRFDQARAAHLKSSFGDVSLDRALGDADVTTGSGRIRIGRIDGQADVKNSNGRTEIGEVTGDVRAKAANGDITIDRAHGSVNAKTANGDIAVGEVMAGTVVLETAAGELRVGILEGTAAWLDLHSSFGNVRNTLDVTGAPAAGDRTVEVRARTSAGDIVISRSTAADATNGRAAR